jgi:ribosome-associated protein
MIPITPAIAIDENDVREDFIRASGPGGQNVNKVSTAVRLHFNINSPSIPDPVRQRLAALAGGRLTEAGVLTIDARRFRTQAANREDALGRLVDLIRQAAQEPRIHRRTRPTPGSRERRLRAKRHRSETKQSRSVIAERTDG